MRFTTTLPAIALATVVALAGITAQPAPVAATDPSPTPTPGETATPAPTADPGPSVTPAPEEPTPEPAPATDPAPTTDPSPTATADPAAPSADPTPSPSPTATPVVIAAAPKPAPTLMDRYRYAARVAIAQRFDRYVSGADGPNAFDCSGLVRYSYRKAKISWRLGGGRSARGMLYWARINGKTSKRNPHVGDVVIWGNGRHAGIYIGSGKVISALNPRQDIRITGLHALGDPFTAFIHTH